MYEEYLYTNRDTGLNAHAIRVTENMVLGAKQLSALFPGYTLDGRKLTIHFFEPDRRGLYTRLNDCDAFVGDWIILTNVTNRSGFIMSNDEFKTTYCRAESKQKTVLNEDEANRNDFVAYILAEDPNANVVTNVTFVDPAIQLAWKVWNHKHNR